MISKESFQDMLINYVSSDLYIMQENKSRFAKQLKANESFQEQYAKLCEQLSQQKDLWKLSLHLMSIVMIFQALN